MNSHYTYPASHQHHLEQEQQVQMLLHETNTNNQEIMTMEERQRQLELKEREDLELAMALSLSLEQQPRYQEPEHTIPSGTFHDNNPAPPSPRSTALSTPLFEAVSRRSSGARFIRKSSNEFC